MGKSKGTLFYQLIRSYIVISLLPLVLALVILHMISEEFMENELQRNFSGLQKSSIDINYELKELDRLSDTLQNDKNLTWLYKKDTGMELKETYQLWESVETVKNHMFQIPLMEECYIILEALDIVIGEYGTYRLQDFYGSIFQDGDKGMDEWKDTFLGKNYKHQIFPAREITLNGTKENRLLYYTTVPFSYYPNQTKGVIMMVLSENRLLEEMNTGVESDAVRQYIMDSSGEMIAGGVQGETFSLPDAVLQNRESGYRTEKRNNEHTVLTYASLEDYNWILAVSVPESEVLTRVKQVQFLLFAIVMAGILITCAMIGIMARRNVLPVTEIMKILGVDRQKEHNEYDTIREHVLELVKNNRDLESSLEDTLPLAREDFLKKLIYGGIFDNAEIENGKRQFGLCLDGASYLIGLIYLDLETNDRSTKYLQECSLYRIIIHNFYKDMPSVFCIDHTETAVIVLASSDDETRWKNVMQSKNEELERLFAVQYKKRVKIFGMESSSGELDIYNAFTRELDRLKEYQEGTEYDASAREASVFYSYPIETENRLINFVRIGNLCETEKLLKKIYTENLEGRHLSMDMIKNLLLELKGSAYKILTHEKNINPEISYSLYCIGQKIPKVKDRQETEELYRQISRCFEQIGENSRKKKTSGSDELIEQILAYVSEHRADTQLGLASVAEEFEMSVTNLSHYFKNKTGRNFSEYVETLRIDMAYDMIQHTSYSLEEIARRCGYGSNDSFRRAFKRCRGILPSKVRNQ